MSGSESKVESRKLKVARELGALWERFASAGSRFSTLLACLPWRLVLGAGCLVFLGIWLHEHDARLRRDGELQQLKQQTSAQVADLGARAEAAMREANQKNARVIADLEARRRQLEREGEALRQRLLLLREDERQRVSEVASLSPTELAERLKSRVPGFEEQVSGVRGQVSGQNFSNDQTRSPGVKSETPDTSHLAPNTLPSPSPGFSAPNLESRIPSPEFLLTEQGARRIETAFVELDSCREQSALKDQGLENCQEQAAVSQAAVGEMHKSLDDLNQAIRWKDEILTRVEAQHRMELKAARGSRLGRFVRAVEYVAVGVTIGVVAR
ncbi:MAG: hypothetical protein ABSA70_12105 [Terriglobia bacterium]